MISLSIKEKLRKFGVEESNLEDFAKQAMQNLNMTESEFEAFLDTSLKNPPASGASSKNKEDEADSGESTAAMIITLILIGLGYLVVWFFYKDQDGWLFPYLGSFLYIFVIYSPAYYIVWWIVHAMNSAIKLSMPPPNRYY